MSHGTHSRMSHATHSRTEHVEGAPVAVTGIIAQRHGLEFANDKRVKSHTPESVTSHTHLRHAKHTHELSMRVMRILPPSPSRDVTSFEVANGTLQNESRHTLTNRAYGRRRVTVIAHARRHGVEVVNELCNKMTTRGCQWVMWRTLRLPIDSTLQNESCHILTNRAYGRARVTVIAHARRQGLEVVIESRLSMSYVTNWRLEIVNESCHKLTNESRHARTNRAFWKVPELPRQSQRAMDDMIWTLSIRHVTHSRMNHSKHTYELNIYKVSLKLPQRAVDVPKWRVSMGHVTLSRMSHDSHSRTEHIVDVAFAVGIASIGCHELKVVNDNMLNVVHIRCKFHRI